LKGGGGGRFVRIDSPKPNPGKDTTAVKKPYHIVSREVETAATSMEEFAKANGQILLPLVELVTQARLVVNEVIDSIGRQTIEPILKLSAEQIAGPRTPGKSSGDIRWLSQEQGGSHRSKIPIVKKSCRTSRET
jgi:hypothetical protein